MALCSETVLVNSNSHEGTVHLLRCKRWNCETCKPFNRMKVMRAAQRGKPNLFMTLTVKHGNYETPDDAARDMKRCLVLLRRRIKRKWGVEKIPFIVVFEKHESGWPHMHLLLRAPFMHWKVLRAMWMQLTGAHQVDVRYIKKHSQVLFYVTKYIGKDLQSFTGCKRWWRSHNYNVVQEDPYTTVIYGHGFEKHFIDWHLLERRIEASGASIERLGRFKYRWEWHRDGGGGYPWL